MSKPMSYEVSRRKFLATSLAGMAVAGMPDWAVAEAVEAENERASALPKRIGPQDQINVAVIGPGGSKGGFRQGLGDTRNIASKPGVRVIAACDVDDQHTQEAAAVFGSDCARYSDFREVIARKDIDAVVIGTPDHWHAIMAIAAMKAGKDVYCEKPMTLTISEGKKVAATQKATKRVFQTGSQQRSDGRFRMACELVRNGRLGKITKVQTHLPGGNVGGPFEVKPVPSGFNWDMWLGPAPMTDYVYERTHGSFRHWLEYSGGMMTDWGAHHNDIMQWALGMDDSGPIAIEAQGSRKFGHNSYNAFQDYDVYYTYPGDINVHCSNKGENGVTFTGEKGTIFVSRGTIQASDDALLAEPLPSNATKLYVSSDHAGNFVDCIRSRKDTICNATVGYRSVSVCHLGNICLRLAGRKLTWDPATDTFPGDAEANSYINRQYRKPWTL